MLPDFWKGMLREERRRVLEVLHHHRGCWTVPCIQELSDAASIPIKDMQLLRLCVEVTIGDPALLDRTGAATINTLDAEAMQVRDRVRSNASAGLHSFCLHPKNPTARRY